MGIAAIKKGKSMERKIVSFREFKEILNNIGLNAYETERFVNAFVEAVEYYENAYVYCENKPISLHVTQCEETIECDFILKDLVRIEVALKHSVVEEFTEEILKERLIERGYTPAEADALYEILKKNENEEC